MARYVTVTFHLQGAITVTSNILRNSNIHSCPNLALLFYRQRSLRDIYTYRLAYPNTKVCR